jgi:hypothetical protein
MLVGGKKSRVLDRLTFDAAICSVSARQCCLVCVKICAHLSAVRSIDPTLPMPVNLVVYSRIRDSLLSLHPHRLPTVLGLILAGGRGEFHQDLLTP